ncbi:MAG: phage scaffolding protein [Clostridia bacterium]
MLELLKEIFGEAYNDEIGQKLDEKINESYITKELSQKEIKEMQITHKEEMKQMRLQNAIDSALSISGARNQKAVSALIDKDSIEIGEDGNILGLSEQLESLKKSDGFLFESKKLKGLSPAEVGDKAYKSPNEMNYEELCNYLNTNKNI